MREFRKRATTQLREGVLARRFFLAAGCWTPPSPPPEHRGVAKKGPDWDKRWVSVRGATALYSKRPGEDSQGVRGRAPLLKPRATPPPTSHPGPLLKSIKPRNRFLFKVGDPPPSPGGWGWVGRTTPFPRGLKKQPLVSRQPPSASLLEFRPPFGPHSVSVAAKVRFSPPPSPRVMGPARGAGGPRPHGRRPLHPPRPPPAAFLWTSSPPSM